MLFPLQESKIQKMNPWLHFEHEEDMSSTFVPLVPPLDKPHDVHPMFLVYEELAKCSLHADVLREQNISRAEVLAKVCTLIIQLVAIHKQTLGEVKKYLRQRDLHIWIFMQSVTDTCPFACVNMVDMKTPAPWAMHVFFGNTAKLYRARAQSQEP